MIDHPKAIMLFKNNKSLISFYFRGKELQYLVTKIIIGYLSIPDIGFHQSIVSENYFDILYNILK